MIFLDSSRSATSRAVESGASSFTIETLSGLFYTRTSRPPSLALSLSHMRHSARPRGETNLSLADLQDALEPPDGEPELPPSLLLAARCSNVSERTSERKSAVLDSS